MQRITSWRWKPNPDKPDQEDSFWFNQDDAWVYIQRGTDGAKERIYRAAWMLAHLAGQPHDKLAKHMKETHDFLLTAQVEQ